jgi:hypothetical protein
VKHFVWIVLALFLTAIFIASRSPASSLSHQPAQAPTDSSTLSAMEQDEEDNESEGTLVRAMT